MTNTEIINNFSNYTIAIIGDLMLDKYLFGKVQRISPQAPVPILNAVKQTQCLGGAGNVMRNVVTLGGKSIAFGVLGKDYIGKQIIKELQNYKIDTKNIFYDNDIVSICKQRVVSGNQQLLRIDYQDIKQISKNIQRSILVNLQSLIKQKKINAIILSDYGKGLFTQQFTQKIIDIANQNNIITIYDPNKRNLINIKNVMIMKPNRSQAYALVNQTQKTSLNVVAKKIQQKYNPKYLIISLSENGMNIYQNEKVTNIPTYAKEVFDVSGAGDTLVSAITLSYLVSNSIELSAKIANIAAGIVVSKLGTATVSNQELLKEVNFNK